MTDITLWFAPDTCSRVVMVALEEIGCPYDAELVVFRRGDHVSPAYLARNPAGKVPTLTVDGRALTEVVAILLWLAEQFPEATLLPAPDDALERARVVADLVHCSSNLHPLVTRMRIPQYFCDLPEARDNVFALAQAAMRRQLAAVEARLAEGTWWYGSRWSIVDAYLNWIWFRITGAGFATADFPNLVRHDAAIRQRPAVAGTLARHRAASEDLDARGLGIRFDGPSAIAPAR